MQFHYQQSGSGPDVVLIHAVTSNLSVWMFSGMLDALAKDFRVTAYDFRGHGHTDAPPSGYTSRDMADDLRRLHENLRLNPALLVGHSYGGVVAMHAALAHPELVKGVIISDTFFPGLRHIEPNFDRANVWTDLRESFARCGLKLGENISFAELFEVVSHLTPEHLEKLKADMGPGSIRWLSQLPRLAQTTCGNDVLEPAGLTETELVKIKQPVIALYDEHSPFQATAKFLESRLLNCKLEIVPGAKHIAVLQNTAVFVEMVARHLHDLS